MVRSNKSALFFLIIVFAVFLSGSVFTRGFNQDKMKMQEQTQQTDKTSKKSPEKKKEDSIIRTGTIDLKKIDANKDGKVFQDMMDYNVISDKSGKCPLCGMTLKEVSLKEAKENAVNAGFKVK